MNLLKAFFIHAMLIYVRLTIICKKIFKTRWSLNFNKWKELIMYLILKKIFEMVIICYWKSNNHCGSDFRDGCQPCGNYEFCKLEDEVKTLTSERK